MGQGSLNNYTQRSGRALKLPARGVYYPAEYPQVTERNVVCQYVVLAESEITKRPPGRGKANELLEKAISAEKPPVIFLDVYVLSLPLQRRISSQKKKKNSLELAGNPRATVTSLFRTGSQLNRTRGAHAFSSARRSQGPHGRRRLWKDIFQRSHTKQPQLPSGGIRTLPLS